MSLPLRCMSFYKGSFHLNVSWRWLYAVGQAHTLLAKGQSLTGSLSDLTSPVPPLSVKLREGGGQAMLLPVLPMELRGGQQCSLPALPVEQLPLALLQPGCICGAVGGSCPRTGPEGAAMVECLPLWVLCLGGGFFWQVGFEAEQGVYWPSIEWEKTTVPYLVATGHAGQHCTAGVSKGIPQPHQMCGLLWGTAAVLKGLQSTNLAYSLIWAHIFKL